MGTTTSEAGECNLPELESSLYGPDTRRSRMHVCGEEQLNGSGEQQLVQ
jgi:hypothetical protein